MAIVARMQASEVNQRGGGRFVACEEGDEGAVALDKASVGSTYGNPPWLEGTGFVRYEAEGQSSEHVKLAAVSAKGKDDPNRDWAMASPSGSLELVIQNPGAFGYVRPGEVYRVTIERVRGPRSDANLRWQGGGVRTSFEGNTIG